MEHVTKASMYSHYGARYKKSEISLVWPLKTKATDFDELAEGRWPNVPCRRVNVCRKRRFYVQRLWNKYDKIYFRIFDIQDEGKGNERFAWKCCSKASFIIEHNCAKQYSYLCPTVCSGWQFLTNARMYVYTQRRNITPFRWSWNDVKIETIDFLNKKMQLFEKRIRRQTERQTKRYTVKDSLNSTLA